MYTSKIFTTDCFLPLWDDVDKFLGTIMQIFVSERKLRTVLSKISTQP